MTDAVDPIRDPARRLQELLSVGRALTAELNLDAVLDRVLETARGLTGARYAAIGVLDDRRAELEQFLTAGIDPGARQVIGDLPHGRGVLGVLIDDPHPIRLHDVSEHPRSFGFPPGHPPMHSFLGAPITVRGEAWGNLYLTEKAGGDDFDDEDVQTIVVLAEWASIAIDNARLYGESERRREALELEARRLAAGRLRATIAAAESERRRWARELHDETLQGLGALKLGLSAALRAPEGEVRQATLEAAVAQLEQEIGGLRSIIRDLRPAILDELGLEAALRALAERTSERGAAERESERGAAERGSARAAADAGAGGAALTVRTRLELGEARLEPEVETAAYRVAQEALTNVVKHAQARSAEISVRVEEGALLVAVTDDGVGLDDAHVSRDGGLGLVGMRERAELVGGTLVVTSSPGATRVLLRLPL